MLKELRCQKLIKNKLEFGSGLNTLLGPDDGANSIGKSSVLMLIDFALSGDDFLRLCSDVTDNVGIITVEMDFIFNKVKYSFSRSTNDPAVVNYITQGKSTEKKIQEYREFLKNKYKFPEGEASFRSSVNPFFRIWGKDNYNPNRPLNSFPNEPYSKIKPNVLKLFSYYDAVHDLEKEKKETESKKKILKGVFEQGYIKPLTKKELKQNENRLEKVESEISEIKKSLETCAISAKKIINDENIKLKSEKDDLVNSLFHTKSRLVRIENNLKYGSLANKKHFEKLRYYFPDFEESKLSKIDQFHSGVTKILKAELRIEKEILEEKIYQLEKEISLIDGKLIKTAGSINQPTGLVDKLLELSIEEKNLRDEIRFREIKESIDTRVVDLSDQLTQKSLESLASIESLLNVCMANLIGKFYSGNPVAPEIKLYDTRYEFKHKDDSGTGKAYANMIALDMSVLNNTYLPILIHDLIVFKNIEVHAIQEIIREYASGDKQIFIAIDEISRYSTEIQRLIRKRKFLSLDSDTLAFGKSWKNQK